ncbi:MAG: protein kinase, partial [Planctomycetes bacterium]|nr:protein kinase [Planctomycetota bacterium]
MAADFDSESYRELRRLLDEAVDLDAEARDRFVESCPERFRPELRRLLAEVSRPTSRVWSALPVPEREPEVDPPERLGPYRLAGEIGRGGMGRVFRATDTRLDRTIALKLLTASWRSDDVRDALRREARTIASLNHPNIATIHSLEEIDGVGFCTLELVEGESLADRLARGPQPLPEIIPIVRQLLSGLEAAHRAGIVHLDLKPANVMVSVEGRVKILDFGVARSIRESAAEVSITGTPGYMSPEHLRGEPVDARSDLFSVGSVLFECFTGLPAFSGDSVADRIRATFEETPEFVRVVNRAGARWGELVASLLARDPEARPRNSAEVRRAVDAIVSGSIGAHRDGHGATDIGRAGLPSRPTPLIGRESVLASIETALIQQRVVTLIGVGGAGKSRVAPEVAHRSHDPVVWVSFAAVVRGGDVVGRWARVLGATLEESDRVSGLAAAIGEGPLLIALDGVEAVLDELRPTIAALLDRCPGLRILITSRARVGLRGEESITVGPLKIPEGSDHDAVHDSEAGRFLIELAARAGSPVDDADPAVLAQLCRRLDGLPLAIELAVGRLSLMEASELDRRLERRFELLRSRETDGPDHHRTLHAAIDWSYQLLGPRERSVFRRLGVFADGATLRAIENVVADETLPAWEVIDVLSDLVDQSLLVVTSTGDGTRFRMLDSVREFARECWAVGDETSGIRSRFLGHYAALANEAELHFQGPDQVLWLDRIAREHENIMEALRVGPTDENEVDRAVDLIGALYYYWELRSRYRAGLDAMEMLYHRLRPDTERRRRAKALNLMSSLRQSLGDFETSMRYQDECTELCRVPGFETQLATSVMNQAIRHKRTGDYDRAAAMYEEALDVFRRMGDRHRQPLALINLAILESDRGQFDSAQERYREAIEIARELGDRHTIASCLASSAIVARSVGDLARAHRRFEEAIATFREVGDREGEARAKGNLALVF